MPQEKNDPDAVRARLEAADAEMASLQASVSRYRQLYNMLEDAVVSIELITDESGHPLDCLFLDHNPAFQRLMDIPSAVGQHCRTVFSAGPEHWLQILEKLMAMEAGQRFEHYIQERRIWVDVYAAAVTESPLQLEIVLSDITERKQSEIRNTFLVQLSDALNGLSSPEAIANSAAGLLRDAIGVRWVAISERDSRDVKAGFGILGTSPDAEAASERIPMQDLADAIPVLETGKPYTTDAGAGIGRIKAVALMPYLKAGTLDFFLGAYHDDSFSWEPRHLDLIRLTTERSWAAIERARAEVALRKSEEQLRITFESATDYAIISTNTGGIIEGWSAGAELVFGYTANEAIGHSADLIFTPEDVATGAPEREMSTARSRGWAADERWHMRRDGSRFYMSGVMRPIFNPALRGYVKVARDMTEQQEAAENLRVSEERYRIALSSAEMGAWDWNIVTDEIAWNEQHYHLLGLPADKLVMEPSDLFDCIHPEDRLRFREILDASVGACGILNAEFRIIRVDNNAIRWMHGYGKVIECEGDRALRMVGVMHDITESKAVEHEKDQFIAVASHELRTPVTAIKAYSEVLRDSLANCDDAMNKGLVLKLDAQVDRLTELIRALLDFTRIREGKLDLKPERFDLGALLLEVQEEMSATYPAGLVLTIAATALVLADRERIRQVLTNLLSNAIRYTPDGAPVEISMSIIEDEAAVAIRDFGSGIPAELREQVFQRYFRADATGDIIYPGLGLGLYIAADIISRHGGRIWVESPDGNGARFMFTLALASDGLS